MGLNFFKIQLISILARRAEPRHYGQKNHTFNAAIQRDQSQVS